MGLNQFSNEELMEELLFNRWGIEKNGSTKDTPKRVVDAYQDELLRGMNIDPEEILKGATFEDDDYDQMICMDGIETFSLCEHHLLPFIGKTHVGYIPNGKVTGLSKIARTVNAFAARPQMQERLTEQVVDAVMEALEPAGAICVVKAQHFCMKMRGVEDSTSYTTTSAIRGRFQDSSVKNEFFDMLDRRRH
jgi:GTP cyclohydrolase I